MKIKVIERGETEFTASTEWTEPDIRAALAGDGKDGNVRSAIYDTTDAERDIDSDQYIIVTEDDGALLWSGWLSGHLKDKAVPGDDKGRPSVNAASMASRYLKAVYGPDVVYRAPETFSNALERWICAVACDAPELAETCMADIEQHFAEQGQPS